MADLIVLLVLALLIMTSFRIYAENSDQAPSPELLEFLGEWETRDGNWFNPLWILKNLDDNDTDEKHAKQKKEENENE